MPPFTEAKLTNPVFEGTWDELLGHSQEFAGKKLRLTVISPEDRPDTIEQSRIAAIDSVFGKYANLGVSVDELHRERQSDKLKEDFPASGSAS